MAQGHGNVPIFPLVLVGLCALLAVAIVVIDHA